mmetsp:Transcript_18092/g.43658  ORF Transcript_18092/g.43658 Transcript_18092/m.43658 type:complete len:357 (-) Transcript_18092:269-1339(-)
MSEAETWKPSTIWLAGGAVVLGAMLWWKLSKPDAPRASEMTGQVAVVTGGTSGIGRETCDRLVSKGVFVVLACRDLEAGRKVAAQLQRLAPQGHSAAVAEAMLCDLASLRSVVAFTDAFRSRGLKCHLLVLNAGMCPPTHQKEPEMTQDGYEVAFQTNHLSHFALTLGLRDVLEASKPARVVVVSSSLHAKRRGELSMDPRLKVESLAALREDWALRPSGMSLYKDSKLANILFMKHLSRQVSAEVFTVNALSPGFIPDTGLSRNQGARGRLFLKYVMAKLPLSFVATIEQGADCVEYVALSKKLTGFTGRYIGGKPLGELKVSDEGDDVELALQLWNLSEDLVRPLFPPDHPLLS